MSYRAYRTITREQAFSRGFDGKWLNVTPNPEFARSNQHDYWIARKILEHLPWAKAVDMCEPGHQNIGRSQRRNGKYVADYYRPHDPDVAVYVKRAARVWLVLHGEYRVLLGPKLREVMKW